jgi:ASC-1-like (ASCH) protein
MSTPSPPETLAAVLDGVLQAARDLRHSLVELERRLVVQDLAAIQGSSTANAVREDMKVWLDGALLRARARLPSGTRVVPWCAGARRIHVVVGNLVTMYFKDPYVFRRMDTKCFVPPSTSPPWALKLDLLLQSCLVPSDGKKKGDGDFSIVEAFYRLTSRDKVDDRFQRLSLLHSMLHFDGSREATFPLWLCWLLGALGCPEAETAFLPPRRRVIALPIQPRYAKLIEDGRKDIEGRINCGKAARVEIGDELLLGTARVLVADVLEFPSFRDMLQTVGVARCLPNETTVNRGVRVYHRFRNYESLAERHGVRAFVMEPLSVPSSSERVA